MAKAMKMSCCDDDWQVEEDLRTLCRAKEIEADPKRLKKCQELARKKRNEMKDIIATDGDTDD